MYDYQECPPNVILWLYEKVGVQFLSRLHSVPSLYAFYKHSVYGYDDYWDGLDAFILDVLV